MAHGRLETDGSCFRNKVNAMNNKSVGPNRRDFIKTTAAATTALAAMSVPRFVHAGTDETLKYGLIGCGNRGSGAAANAMEADPNARLVAMGDTFETSALNARESIKRAAPKGQMAVDDDHIFSGFDAYKKVID